MTAENFEITQKSAMGSNTTQVAKQVIYNMGLSRSEVTQIIFETLAEYCPKMKREILEELKESLSEKLKNIPIENIVSPVLRIAVPALQNASITEEREIREVYANLLANSMNNETKNNLHPGFTEIIKQLCPDEAKMLYRIFCRKFVPIISIYVKRQNNSEKSINMLRNFSNIDAWAKCEHVENSGMYFDNLTRLGLIEIPSTSSFFSPKVYEPLKTHPLVSAVLIRAKETMGPYNQVSFTEEVITLTDYGYRFCEKCIVNPASSKGKS